MTQEECDKLKARYETKQDALYQIAEEEKALKKLRDGTIWVRVEIGNDLDGVFEWDSEVNKDQAGLYATIRAELIAVLEQRIAESRRLYAEL